MIVAFHALAAFVEAPLLAWSERVRARWFSAGSLAVVALSSFAAALYPRGVCLFVALAIYGPASGCALSIAEGLLVEAAPQARERTMARVSLAANAGDLAVPLLLGALSWCGLGFRTAFAIAGATAALLAISHASARALDRNAKLDDEGADEPAPTIPQALRVAIGTRPLLVWSFVCALTALLDEVLVAFSALHLDAMGTTPNARSFAIGAWVVGGFVGLAFLERFVDRIGPRRVLGWACAATALELVVLARSHSPLVGTGAMFLIGITGSTLHPLTKARAYAALPQRPALVNAVASALLPFDMAAPMLLGVLATFSGSRWAILGLLVAPLGVATAAWRLEIGGAPE